MNTHFIFSNTRSGPQFVYHLSTSHTWLGPHASRAQLSSSDRVLIADWYASHEKGFRDELLIFQMTEKWRGRCAVLIGVRGVLRSWAHLEIAPRWENEDLTQG